MPWNFKTTIIQLLTLAPQLSPEVLERPAVRNPIAVSLGAIAGALSRYYLSIWFARQFGTDFPYSTLFVNFGGSWLMGFFVTALGERLVVVSPEIQLLLAVGFLGSFTTFSSYELDVFRLVERRAIALAAAYWAGSAILGAIGLLGGVWTARFVATRF